MKPLNQLNRPFLIAEVGGNHEGDMQYAEKLTRDAAAAGADAVKFQTYTPDRIVSKIESPIRHKHFGKFALTTQQYVDLAKLCESLNVQFMTSIWDLESIHALDPFIQVHKVGSGDLTNYRLLKPLAETGKPLCIATAMSKLADVRDTVAFIRRVNPKLVAEGNLCVMHCVAMYGNPRDEFANLNAIEALRDEFSPEIAIGYSDHTMGNVATTAAVAMGANVIETHFTDDQSREFRDHHFAHNPKEFADLVEFCDRRSVMLGQREKKPVSGVETDKRIWEFRRAVYFSRDMKAGEVANEENLTTLRPCEGIPATRYFDVIGQTLIKDKSAFQRLSWGDFEGAF